MNSQNILFSEIFSAVQCLKIEGLFYIKDVGF
jgi:hypothetical protein